MKIVSLTAENVKRLKAVAIKPDGSLVVIGGKNGAGKSSVLDSISYALGGKALCPEMPIRKGEKRASVKIDVGEFVIERTFTEAGGGTLKVTNAGGFKASSPQTILDGLVGKLSFDPLAFASMEPQKQAETLRALAGLDFMKHDAERNVTYDQRTIHNREAKFLEAQLAAVPDVEAPAEEVSVAALMQEIEAIRAHNAVGEKLKAEVDEHVRALRDLQANIEHVEKEIKELLEKVKLRREQKAEFEAIRVKGQKTLGEKQAALVSYPFKDAKAIESKITESDAVNQKVRARKQREQLAKSLAGKRAEVADDTKELEALDKAKADAISAAKLPVGGLSFDAAGVQFNGIPFEQASSAEKLRVSVAMGLAMNPKLKVLLIRDGSLLDADNLKLVAEMATAADAQVWIEKVTTEQGECQVIIEDGAIKPKE